MNLDILFIIFIGYFIRVAHSGGHGGKDVHVKILVPVHKHTHKHTHTIYKKPKEEKKIVIHKHVHKHGHGHKHGHKQGHKHKHGHKHDHYHGHKHHHGHKHKHDHHHTHKGGHHHHRHHDHGHHHNDDWSKHSNVGTFNDKGGFVPSPQVNSYGIPTYNDIYSGPEPEVFDNDDDYHTSLKSIKSESFHITEAKNSDALDPVGKHFVTGNYEVSETDPNDITNTKYHNVFQTPLANINLHESNYEPTEYDTVEYDDGEEEGDYEDDDGNGLEYEDGAETVVQNNEAPNNNNVFGIEALKQFFHNKV